MSNKEFNKTDELYYTPREIATMLKLHIQTVRHAINAKKLKAFKFSNRWRILKKDFEEYKRNRGN